MQNATAGFDAPQKKALIIGLGASGLAAARHLTRQGRSIRIADTREAPAGAKVLAEEMPAAEIVTGGLPLSLLDGADLVVMSPGLSPDFGAAAPLVKEARSRGLEVIGEIELFARALNRLAAECGYRPKVIGITGTNGKTTTTTLVQKMAAAGGVYAVAAGNIGPNAVTELDRAQDAGRLPDVWVLELSSFQLATTSSLHCCAAALLNVTEDHLDWHGGMDAYAAAKARIFSNGTVRVVNREDARTVSLARGGAMRTFGSDVPVHTGDRGLVTQGGQVWLARRCAAPEGLPSVCSLALPEHALLIAGRHNTMNALAALALIEAAGLPEGPALDALLCYRGEPHRVERVLEADGVTFVDDSKGTNVGAVEAAVKGFHAQGRRLLMVMGGDGKGQDFSPLGAALAPCAGAVALIGRDAEKIEAALTPVSAPKQRFATLEEAVDWLWSCRRPGDILLLSPACASWDMFRDYAERSARFIACARRLAGEA